ncbi:hypothetical protein DFH29DRAFT_840296 [Suillus ampliporus]|nr:hypothetical protein DFH29DRAFT_840296 [Suillus ampliporus]
MMHRALFISDILLSIFGFLDPILSGDSSCWKSLQALARTCKTFYEPAMNLLWANIHGVEPLLRCVTRLRPMISRSGGI